MQHTTSPATVPFVFVLARMKYHLAKVHLLLPLHHLQMQQQRPQLHQVEVMVVILPTAIVLNAFVLDLKVKKSKRVNRETVNNYYYLHRL